MGPGRQRDSGTVLHHTILPPAQKLFVQLDHLAAHGPLQKVTGYTDHHNINNVTSAIKTKSLVDFDERNSQTVDYL